jgi:hypothetical protein
MTTLSGKMIADLNTTAGCTFVVMAFENVATTESSRT